MKQKKYEYNLQQFEVIRYFAKIFFCRWNFLKDVHKDQSYLSTEIVEFIYFMKAARLLLKFLETKYFHFHQVKVQVLKY